MLFNSTQFLIFFPVVTAGFFLLPHRVRWFWLLAASCYFYMAFVPAYIFILLGTILVDYAAGLWIEGRQGHARRAALIASLVANAGVLFVFKYFNFFNQTIADLASLTGSTWRFQGLALILPIGLSFHTFQSMSYVIEVYRGNQKPERHLGIYALYVMFYPQLVAGPIERPQNLLHQFHEVKVFRYDDAVFGLRQAAIGFFKKVVIADRLAVFVNYVYRDPRSQSGLPLMVATLFFAIQIYCDFSGYSDIAIGTARFMGFRLMKNFEAPYLAQSVSEFWKRWHISLSTWFKDYLYISLGGNRASKPRWYFNLFVTFLVSGLWHGANWTYVAWGALNGVYLIASVVTQKSRETAARAIGLQRFPALAAGLSIVATFSLTCFAWIFFRARSIRDAFYVVGHLFSFAGHGPTQWAAGLREQFHASGFGVADMEIALAGVAILIVLDTFEKRTGRPFGELVAWCPRPIRWSMYYALVVGIIAFGMFGSRNDFIYFQF